MIEINPKSLDIKRQKKWKESGIYTVIEDPNKPKFYVLDMFPYPSGAGLHVGHPKGFMASDCLTRKKMLEGFSVLHPMGFDTFGLGTENYAIEHKMKPQIVAKKNIDTYIKQLEMFGCTYDRDRCVSTADPEFFKWTQRIFLKLYNHYYDEKENKAMPITDPNNQERLAYIDYKPINRCPKCKTGLANEDLDDGKCERCGSEVEQKPMKQRVLRITKYAQRLIDGLDKLNWDESMKELERNRIGKSEGTQFRMNICHREEGNDGLSRNGGMAISKIASPSARNDEQLSFEVYTTRIDTVFGMSFVVMAPEHPLVNQITTDEFKEEIEKYKEAAKYKTQLERTELQKDKSGQFTGSYAINPFNNEKVPIYIADYVLANYGTGVVMAVPAHDERDFEFAKKYGIKIIQSIMPDSFDLKNPPRPDKKNTERNTVHVILRNTKDKTVLIHFLKGEQRGNLEPKNFIIGGIEDGESELEAAIREIKEETGYTNIKFIEKVPFEIQANFFAAHKDVNRKIHVNTLVFDLLGNERVEITEDEHFTKDSHEIHWIAYDKIAETINIIDDEMSRKYFYENGFAYTEKGILINSEGFSGLNSDDAIIKMQERLNKKGIGGKKMNYKIQDRVFSRQRYRGEPFPIIFCDKCGTLPMNEADLPLLLPDVENYEPTGTEEGPLANVQEWINTTCPICGGKAKRESNTMPGRAGSSRYRMRYMDNKNYKELVSKQRDEYRKNVDVYIGGAEHVTRHMIYARFWQKFLYDIGIVSQDEPFLEYHSVGLIMGEDGRKMSKRRGNVVNPDDIINEHGADTLRTYEMFMGPFDQSIAWSTNGISGVKKFLEKIIKLFDKIKNKYQDANDTEIILNQSIKKLTEDIDGFRFNTAVSQLMILVNHLTEKEKISREIYEKLIVLVAPMAPHMAEEMREKLGNEFSIFNKGVWPKYDETKLISDQVNLAVQINGKMRGTVELSREATESDVMEKIKSDGKLANYLTGEPKKIIYVKGKILNIIL